MIITHFYTRTAKSRRPLLYSRRIMYASLLGLQAVCLIIKFPHLRPVAVTIKRHCCCCFFNLGDRNSDCTNIEVRNRICSFLFQRKATSSISLMLTYDLILHMQNNPEGTIHSIHASCEYIWKISSLFCDTVSHCIHQPR